MIRQMDPPSGQAYLALLPTGLAAVGDGGSLPEDRPFPWLPRMDYEEYGQAGLGPDDPPRSVDHGGAKGQLRKQVVTDSLLSAAVLDYALNNTSLMLSIQVGRQFLLFPGDSQWGTWNKAMETPWAADLLRRSTFYKVGHHGSHNATPRKFVDQLMPDGCWSIASVAPYSRWSEIPKPELLDALARRAPNRVFTTLSPPDSPPPGVVVHDEGAAIDFVLEA